MDQNNETTTGAGWTLGNMDEGKAISRIQKLLALANNAGTEEEAAKASALAQEMLAAYNLEMAQIDATPEATSATDDGKRIKDKYQRSAMFAYQRTLWKAIAEANYCWYQATPIYGTNSKGVHSRKTYHHYIIGRQTNVITTRLMGDYLEETINRLVPFKPGRDSSKSWISWKEGCTARLCERLAQKRQDMEAESQRKAEEAARQPGAQMGLTLRNVAETEEDLNYKLIYGEEAYRRRLSWRHDRQNCVCEYCVQYREQMATLKVLDTKLREEAEPEKVETEAQKRKREEREQKRWEKHRRDEEAKRRRYWAKKDVRAYVSGQEAGTKIGLDTQVGGARDSSTLRER